jgi:hypothetical protein
MHILHRCWCYCIEIKNALNVDIRHFSCKANSFSSSQDFSHFLEIENFLLSSQQPVFVSYPQHHKSSPHTHNFISSKPMSILKLTFHLRLDLPQIFFLSDIPSRNSYIPWVKDGIAGNSMCNLRWRNWPWKRVPSEYLSFHLSYNSTIAPQTYSYFIHLPQTLGPR